MKLRVNEEICIRCGACTGICPKCFKMDEQTAQVSVKEIKEEDMEAAKDAMAGCPVGAIEEIKDKKEDK